MELYEVQWPCSIEWKVLRIMNWEYEKVTVVVYCNVSSRILLKGVWEILNNSSQYD